MTGDSSPITATTIWSPALRYDDMCRIGRRRHHRLPA